MMDRFYKNLHDRMSNPEAAGFLNLADSCVTGYVFLSYPVFLMYLLIGGNNSLIRTISVTAVSFIILSMFRKLVNRKRPYETYGFKPVLKKASKGRSFPSRHVFSAFVIATAAFPILPAYSVSVVLAGMAIMVIRVAGCVHFVSDVLAGAAIGILSGLTVLL